MGNETSKTKKIWDESFLSLLTGEGIDIGCGNDPVLSTVDRFDIEHGDANEVTHFVNKKYDFVYSAHTLEHMYDPQKTLKD